MYIAEAAAALAVLVAPGHSHPPAVTVQPGDTLSEIAQEHCGAAGYYPGLARASGIRNPDKIGIGQRVTILCSTAGPRSPATLTSTGRRAARSYSGRHRAGGYSGHSDPFDGHRDACGDGDGDGMDMPCSLLHRGGTPAYTGRHRTYRAAATSGGGRVTPGSGFEACVISRESGGNAQVMNPSGHYGLYQFSASTWQAYGGSAADFGHASAFEQRRIFLNAMATPGGAANWSPYDGCPA